MACSGCSTGRGCGSGGGCSTKGGGCNKLNVFDWLANMELPSGQKPFDIVEVRFKNSRKEFFRNRNNLQLLVGNIVVVESAQGYDVGVISISGELVRLQMRKKKVNDDGQIKAVLRKATPADVERWRDAQALETNTLVRARILASSMKLDMKINDIEIQGDKSHISFYYTAPGRVDFRELIKAYATEFRSRIQMWQIGERQEAGRLGGIGSCGRELCCSTWLTDFRSVSTTAARYQQLALNPVKLAGQCGKLKCCLNYELDSYLDALKDFPQPMDLETEKGRAFHQKTDIFKRILWYTYSDAPDNFVALSTDRVKHIVEMNKQGKRPAELDENKFTEKKEVGYVVGKQSPPPGAGRSQQQQRPQRQQRPPGRRRPPNRDTPPPKKI
ncbi:MAG TPA: regulatory iron-sulfur-containing complex subunit RicT [Bacteroidia bacterium]|nr:regulatory iron-sulfur-containing complex subunit RicT [Bacteroidia bacterium]